MIKVCVEMDLPSGRRLPCVDPLRTEFKFQSENVAFTEVPNYLPVQTPSEWEACRGVPRFVCSPVLQD